MNIKIVLKGAAITKKNSQRIVRAGNRPMILPSAQYKEYEAACMAQIPSRKRQRIDIPVNVQCVYYMPTRRRVDISNLNSALHDILVRAGVLADDNRDVIAGTDGSRVFYDKEDPRVEITITNMLGYEQWRKQ